MSREISSAGRRALILAVISITCLVLYSGTLAVGAASDNATLAIRLGAPILLLAMGTGVAATVFALLGLQRGDRALPVIVLALFSSAMLALLLFFIVADILSSTGGGSRGVEVHVEFVDGRVRMPSIVGTGGQRVTFVITNNESRPQRVGIMQLLPFNSAGSLVTPFAANRFPLIDGQVRWYTYPDEASVAFWATGDPVLISVDRGSEPPPRPKSLAVDVAPGTTYRLRLRKDTPFAGLVFVVYSDLPGQYAASQWAPIQLFD